jgi:hypothetical protein
MSNAQGVGHWETHTSKEDGLSGVLVVIFKDGSEKIASEITDDDDLDWISDYDVKDSKDDPISFSKVKKLIPDWVSLVRKAIPYLDRVIS